MLTGTRPTQQREVERRRKIHLEKIRSAPPTSQSNSKPNLDMDKPEVYPHMNRNRKKEWMKKELLQKTERENLLLMAKIYGIMNIDAKEAGRAFAPGIRLDANMRPTLDCYNNGDVWLPGQAVLHIKPINGKAREREYKRNVEENMKIARLLHESKPTYSRADFGVQWEKTAAYRDNIRRNHTAGYLAMPSPAHSNLGSPSKKALNHSQPPSPIRGAGMAAVNQLRASREAHPEVEEERPGSRQLIRTPEKNNTPSRPWSRSQTPLKPEQSSFMTFEQQDSAISEDTLQKKLPELSFVHRAKVPTAYGSMADIIVSDLTSIGTQQGIFVMVKDDVWSLTGFRFISVGSLCSVCEPQTSSVLILADSLHDSSFDVLLSPGQQSGLFEDLCSKCVISKLNEGSALSINFTLTASR